MNVRFLGTGTSHGVPSIDCMRSEYTRCPKDVCRLSQHDKRHRRSRTSILVETENGNILVDVSADFRYQMLREKITQVDAVLITHSHSDHIGGIPDIRSYTTDKTLKIFCSAETITSVRKSFDYIFNPETFVGGGIPKVELLEIDSKITLLGQEVIPVRVIHGALNGALGFRIGNLGYIPDMKSIDDIELDKLRGVKTLILNCLRVEPLHSTHLTLDESLALARKIAPEKCYFIHMCHDIHYELDSVKLDSWMEFSYDGLVITI